MRPGCSYIKPAADTPPTIVYFSLYQGGVFGGEGAFGESSFGGCELTKVSPWKMEPKTQHCGLP